MSSALRSCLPLSIVKRSMYYATTNFSYNDLLILATSSFVSLRWNSAKAATASAPRKITTHYTIYPRDKDERWKGTINRQQFHFVRIDLCRCQHGTLR